LGWWLSAARQGAFWQADFTAFYLGGRLALDGRGADLYDLDVQLAYQRELVPERPPESGLLPFLNPPHGALVFAALALLPRAGAFYACAAAQVALAALALRLLLRLAPEWEAWPRLLLVVTFLAYPPLFITFQLGQLALVGLLCLAGFYAALARGQDGAAAAWLVLGTIKPQLMLVPAVTLLVLGRWRALLLASALFAAWA